MIGTIERRVRMAVMLLAAASLAGQSVAAQTHQPTWRTHLVAWAAHSSQPRPWRRDPRLSGRAEPGYPDDFEVWFGSADSMHGPAERMWVRTIDYDPATDLFLAVLLNHPDQLRSLHAGDNVVFRIDRVHGVPVAVGAPDYAQAGWSTASDDAFTPVLRDGLRAYRAGSMSGDMTAMDHCIAVLSPAMTTAAAVATHEEQYTAHYLLGRCLAERHQAARAIDEFRAAVELEPDAGDAHMALLAELSAMAHRRAGAVATADDARWRRAFLDELAIVHDRFMDSDGVTQGLALVSDPAQATGVAPMWQPPATAGRR